MERTQQLVCYCQKHYNQSLQHQQGTEEPRSTNPVNGHIIVSESSSIRQDELHLNQATAQPRSKNQVDATTGNIIINASASILNEELIVAQATTQPRNATPIDTTKSNNVSSRVPFDESLLDQATVQPRNKYPVNLTTDNDGITINASTTSILNEESIEEPRSGTPINMTADNYGIVFNPTNRVCHEESIGAQPTIELESNAPVEPISPQHGESVENNATSQPSSTNQNHRKEPSNTVSPQDGAAVKNNDCDVNASCGIQQWELDSAAATKQQIYLDENRNAIPRNKAEVALLPAEFEAFVRSAVKEAVQQVSLERAPLLNALKCQIEMLEPRLLALTQGDIGSNITHVPTRAQMQRVYFCDGTTHIVNTGIENIASMCYLNAYLQVIASCPTLPACMWNTLSLSPKSYHCTVLWQLLLVHWLVKTRQRNQWIRTIFSKNSLKHILISFQYPIQINVSNVGAICSKYA
jgi:hypothetical protein